MPVIDVTKELKKYEGQWVALTDEKHPRVIGNGKILKEAKEQAIKNGYPNPVYTKVPDSSSTYIL